MHSNNNLSFGSKPIYRMNVISRKRNNEFIPVLFSELDKSSDSDIALMSSLNSTKWSLCPIFSQLCEDFTNKKPGKNFFIIESIYNNTVDRIKSIISITKEKTKITVNQLISSPKEQEENEIKGAGATAILGIIKIAKKENIPEISLCSTEDIFYERLGFKQDDFTCLMQLGSEKFDKVIETISRKYKID